MGDGKCDEESKSRNRRLQAPTPPKPKVDCKKLGDDLEDAWEEYGMCYRPSSLNALVKWSLDLLKKYKVIKDTKDTCGDVNSDIEKGLNELQKDNCAVEEPEKKTRNRSLQAPTPAPAPTPAADTNPCNKKWDDLQTNLKKKS